MKTDEELVLRIPVKKARAPRVPKPPQPPSHLAGRIEVTRSWSYKLNMGNYESRDFFQAAKMECAYKDAEELADTLQAFCKKMVMKAVREYQAELREELAHPVAQANAREFQRRQG